MDWFNSLECAALSALWSAATVSQFGSLKASLMLSNDERESAAPSRRAAKAPTRRRTPGSCVFS